MAMAFSQIVASYLTSIYVASQLVYARLLKIPACLRIAGHIQFV